MPFFNGDILQNCCFPSLLITLARKYLTAEKKQSTQGKTTLDWDISCMSNQEPVSTCWENKPVSPYRPLMLDNGISAPQVAKFSRHLSTDPLHDPYFIQSVGLRQPLSFVGFLWPGWKNVWSNNTDYRVSSLARVWQWGREEVCKSEWHLLFLQLPSFREGHMLACACAAMFMWEAMGYGRERQSPHARVSLVLLQPGLSQGEKGRSML